nr:PREDICTED: uncharacterized protein LOC106706003 [Latimeria chalumnae]|eukprot:XP_014351797.1 PREDICTED: uncharacterized protein LOC106706003 [Latimeria chalumnae]
MEILEAEVMMPDTKPEADAIVIDGSALVNILPPHTSKTFDDYAREDVLPKLESYCTKYKRIDIVFDVCWQFSLKFETKSKWGKGIRRRVTGTSKTPTNWRSFLRNDNNKTELFHFLVDKIAEISTTNTVIMTKGENIISNQMICLEDMAPCTHEEADTHIFVHARRATMRGNKVFMINANDTDVVVIAISVLSSLKELGLEKGLPLVKERIPNGFQYMT